MTEIEKELERIYEKKRMDAIKDLQQKFDEDIMRIAVAMLEHVDIEQVVEAFDFTPEKENELRNYIQNRNS